jgi:putative SOS response-associated peptidase YedK
LNFSRERRNPVEGDHLIYGFLATEPNAFVAPVHAKARPVILTTKEEHDTSDASPRTDDRGSRREQTGWSLEAA